MAEERVQRKLAAILAVDVVGYSRLMGEDEAGTLAKLKVHREELVDSAIAESHGRIVKLIGDGALVEFASAVDALECAVTIQRKMADRNAEVPEAQQIQFRIGLNLGDIIVEHDDIYGNGVNVAARLEALAEPGGICISGRVLDQVEKNVKVGFAFLGAQAVKNIEKPVNAYKVLLDPADAGSIVGAPNAFGAPRWRMLGVAATLILIVGIAGAALWSFSPRELVPTVTSVTAKKAKNLSIVVLPFDNLSGDSDQDYLADAITEDLITDLSRIRDAFVIARRTSFTYRGSATDVKAVAAELGVRYVLEGSVRRSGNQVRINAQLIDGQTGSHVWSDRFDRELANVFSLQNDVTGRIASVLKAELREAESQRQGPPASMEAWDYALKGNVLLVRPTREFVEAKRLLEKALELDPNIASAWSGLAFVHFAASFGNIPGVSAPNSSQLSLEAAQKAVSLDPKNAEGHWMIGVGYARNHQPERGWASCETAMDLNPNNDCGYVCAGLTNMALGKPDEAIPFFQESLRLNPRFRTFTKYKYMGHAKIHAGEDADAVTLLNKAIAASPNDATATLALVSALAMLGREDEARTTLDRFRELVGEERATIESLRASYSWMGPGVERLLEGLRRAGMPER